ncbi:ADP-ribosylation factor 6 [Acropora cervicornis]|uniref:ADP-ribosylation factor 6 n=1 Tax=Acropora cervicornis TaxID=6130 RepID=A0AAD9VBK7_ACRCE|nr:ADP-ribosylation factor 6 [Acropora cervicornis]
MDNDPPFEQLVPGVFLLQQATTCDLLDVGGQDKIRPLWRHYYAGTQGLIFVVDCADRDRIDEARQELHRIINDRLMKEAIILIFANKQDLPDGIHCAISVLVFMASANNEATRSSREARAYKNSRTELDVGGQDKIRPLWRHYYNGTQGLIFVVDCADLDRIDEARTELHRIVNDREMKDALILIFANKQDLPDAIKPHDLQERLHLSRLRDRNWYVQPSCATSGDGLYDGLTWLCSNHKH